MFVYNMDFGVIVYLIEYSFIITLAVSCLQGYWEPFMKVASFPNGIWTDGLCPVTCSLIPMKFQEPSVSNINLQSADDDDYEDDDDESCHLCNWCQYWDLAHVL